MRLASHTRLRFLGIPPKHIIIQNFLSQKYGDFLEYFQHNFPDTLNCSTDYWPEVFVIQIGWNLFQFCLVWPRLAGGQRWLIRIHQAFFCKLPSVGEVRESGKRIYLTSFAGCKLEGGRWWSVRKEGSWWCDVCCILDPRLGSNFLFNILLMKMI